MSMISVKGTRQQADGESQGNRQDADGMLAMSRTPYMFGFVVTAITLYVKSIYGAWYAEDANAAMRRPGGNATDTESTPKRTYFSSDIDVRPVRHPDEEEAPAFIRSSNLIPLKMPPNRQLLQSSSLSTGQDAGLSLSDSGTIDYNGIKAGSSSSNSVLPVGLTLSLTLEPSNDNGFAPGLFAAARVSAGPESSNSEMLAPVLNDTADAAQIAPVKAADRLRKEPLDHHQSTMASRKSSAAAPAGGRDQFATTAVLIALTELVRDASEANASAGNAAGLQAMVEPFALPDTAFELVAVETGSTIPGPDISPVALDLAPAQISAILSELMIAGAGLETLSTAEESPGEAAAGAESDSVMMFASTGPFELTEAASEYADTIVGTAGQDVIDGHGGDDVIFGGAGDDWLSGGAGNDSIDGGSGDDQMYGGAGNDQLEGGVGSDNIDGGAGYDKLLGGTGDDHLFGGDGEDVLDGGAGADVVSGGDGNDIIHSTPDGETDVQDGGAGLDTLSYAAATASVTFDLNDGTVSIGTESGMEVDLQTNFEVFVAGSGDDMFHAGVTPTVDAPTLTITPVTDDILIGGTGVDTLSYEKSEESVVIDVADGTAAGEQIGTDHFAGIEHFVGGSGDDIFEAAGAAPEFSVQSSILTLMEGGQAPDIGAGLSPLESALHRIAEAAAITLPVLDEAVPAPPESLTEDVVLPFARISPVSESEIETVETATLDVAAEDHHFDGGGGFDTLSYAEAVSDLIIDTVAGIASGTDIGTDTFASIEAIVGGKGDDSITISAEIVSVDGGSGSDIFIFMSGTLATDDDSGRGCEITNFEVGDVIRMSKWDLFEQVLDEIEDTFDSIYGDSSYVGDGAIDDHMSIRIRQELHEDRWTTYVDRDDNNDSLFDLTITMDGQHNLTIVNNHSGHG